DLSGHLSQRDLGACTERPPQYRGTRTDSIAAISDMANSAVAATRHAPGDRLELPDPNCPRSTPRGQPSGARKETSSTANPTRRPPVVGTRFRCQKMAPASPKKSPCSVKDRPPPPPPPSPIQTGSVRGMLILTPIIFGAVSHAVAPGQPA